MVSATPSGGWLQSSPIIPQLGFALGTRLQMFWLESGHANSLIPGKRPRTTLTPSMCFKQGHPYLAFGTPGGDQQEQWSLQLFLRHVDMGQPLQHSIDSPAFHTEHLVSSFWPRDVQLGSLALEGRHSEATIQALRVLGHTVSVGGPWSEGRLSACLRDTSGDHPIVRAGANPRGMQGYAIAR
jgi:gamma-glutamyltranspeptidase/glutathione hydrolase